MNYTGELSLSNKPLSGAYTLRISPRNCDCQAETSVQLTFPTHSLVATKTFMMTNLTTPIWSDGKTYYQIGNVNDPSRQVPPANVTIVDVPKMREIIDYWSEMGGTSISIPIEWSVTETSPGQFEFRHVDWIINYAASKGVKIVAKIWPFLRWQEVFAGVNRETISWKYEESDTPRKPDQTPVEHFMSLYSERRPNFDRWLRGVAQFLAPHQNAGHLIYAGVMMSEDLEHNASIPGGGGAPTDWHPANIAAWQSWYQNEYGTPAPNPPTDPGSGQLHQRWLKFNNKSLNDFATYWVGVLKEYANFFSVYDTGSFSDGIADRQVWAALATNSETGINGYKHNPGLGYPKKFVSRIVKEPTNWSSVEWTNDSFNVPDYQTRLSQLIEGFRASIDTAANDLSFAFFDHAGTGPLNMLSDVVSALKNSGHWNKPILDTPSNAPLMTLSVLDALSSGGYHNKASTYDAFNDPLVRIKVVNDLN